MMSDRYDRIQYEKHLRLMNKKRKIRKIKRKMGLLMLLSELEKKDKENVQK